MSTAQISLSYTAFVAPAGTVVDHVLVTLTQPDATTQTASIADNATSVSFNVTLTGDYSVVAQAQAADGSSIGPAAPAATFTISAPTTVTVLVPSTLSAVVS
jgi:hypothetical protein